MTSGGAAPASRPLCHPVAGETRTLPRLAPGRLRGLLPGQGGAGGPLLLVLAVPLVPHGRERLHPVGLPGGEVVHLAAVGGEVVELPGRVGAGGDDLPVAVAQRAVPLVLE